MAALAAPDAHSILKESDQARGGGLPGIVWEIKLQSRDGERKDEPQRILVKAVDDSSVAETQEPVRFKGSKILQVERSMWMTRPGLSKPIPISPRQRMSGQASNGDIAATNYAGDYDAEMSGYRNRERRGMLRAESHRQDTNAPPTTRSATGCRSSAWLASRPSSIR